MRLSRKLLVVCAFALAAAGVAGCGSGIPGNSVASVAGNPITQRTLDHWMFTYVKSQTSSSSTSPVIVPNDPPNFKGCLKQVRRLLPTLAKTSNKVIKLDCQTLFKEVSSQMMQFLIESYWYQGDAHKLHIKVTTAEAIKALNAARKQSFPTAKAWTAFLASSGYTIDDLIYRFRITAIAQKLLAREQSPITQAAIATYYSSHASQFGTQAIRNLRIVRTNSQSQASAALVALKSGQSWTTVAKHYSVDQATKSDGGLLAGVTNGEEEHALNQVAFSAPLNKLEGPVHGTFGWYVVEVIKITPATHQTLAQATPLIKQLLTSANQTAAQTKVTNLSKKFWHAKTICRAAYAIADCHGYKAPATTTTPTTTTPATTAPATTAPATTSTSTTPATTTGSGTTTGTGTTTTK